MKNRFPGLLALLALLPGFAGSALAQAVAVTLRLDTNTVGICETTTLRVFAQVVPSLRPNSDRVFSWYVDVLHTNGIVAFANYPGLVKPTSDNDPQTSSKGFTVGAERRGIYDTFLNRPGAGVTSAVELLSIPITGQSAGQTRFLVRHGSGVPNLAEDFIVAPLGGGGFQTGGDYSAAFVDLTVVSGTTMREKRLAIAHQRLGGATNKASLSFGAVAGCDCFVEFRNELASGPAWQAFPNGPHNAGVYFDTNTTPRRFYRLRAVPVGR